MIVVGKMRRRLTLQTLTETADGYGQPVQSWSTVGTYWGQVKPLSGREAVNAAQIKAEVSHMVTTRWLGSVATGNPTMRWVYQGRNLNIVDVIDVDEAKRELQWVCNEIVEPPGS